MIAALLLAAAAPVAAPRPEELELYADWIVGCDNVRACQAVALMPESMPDGSVTMVVTRAPEAGAAVKIEFVVDDSASAAGLEADGRRLPVRLIMGDDVAEVAPRDVPAVVTAFRSAKILKLVGRDGASLGTVSLAGASAALLYMDDRQKRAGTATALVRPGPRPASAVPAAPPLPVVHALPVPGAPSIAVGTAQIRAQRRKSGCEIEEVGGPDEQELHAIGPSQTLLLLACGSGAYNVSYVPLIVTRNGRSVRIAEARFDAPEDWWGEVKHPILVNADWDSSNGLLGSFSKGRGLGDCGTRNDYAWDGARFRLVGQTAMTECRGSLDYIPTWRARVVRP